MKKFAVISILILVVSFLFIYLSKDKNESTGKTIKSVEKDSVEKKDIRSFWSHYRKATNSRISGEWVKAIVFYNKALDINPEHEDALYYRGNMYWEIKNYDSALLSWRQLEQINPHSSRVYIQKGNLYLNPNSGHFDPDQAENAFKNALEINKEETGPVLGLGMVFLIKGDLQTSEDYFGAVIGSNPESIEAHYFKGYIAWKKQNKDLALELFNDAWKLSQPAKQETEFSNEGDTKSGESLHRKDSGNLFFKHISKLKEMNSENISKKMEINYNGLNSSLNEIRNR